MSEKVKNNIVIGVMTVLISTAIIGGFALASEFYIFKAKQEMHNTNHDEQKEKFNKMYRVTVNQMNNINDNLTDKIEKIDEANTKQHGALSTSIQQLTWAVTKNNNAVKETLKEIKNFNNYSLIVCKKPIENDTD